jgi:hypothetical protein
VNLKVFPQEKATKKIFLHQPKNDVFILSISKLHEKEKGNLGCKKIFAGSQNQG